MTKHALGDNFLKSILHHYYYSVISLLLVYIIIINLCIFLVYTFIQRHRGGKGQKKTIMCSLNK